MDDGNEIGNMDNLENRFKETFAGYAKEPPAGVWDRIEEELHPKPASRSLWEQMLLTREASPRILRYVAAVAAASVALFFIILYFSSGEKHMLRGHAYAGDARLCRGTAYLFKVNDKAIPLDSIEHCCSTRVSESGAYQFNGVESGRYLLRVSPDAASEFSLKFHPSWHEQHQESDSAHLLVVGEADVHADVHLVEKR